MRDFLPYFSLWLVVALLFAAAIRSYSSSLKLTNVDWKDLVSRLQQLNEEGVATVAREFLEPHARQIEMEPDQIWELIGGYEGLNRMRENANIMLALAVYTQRWNFDESVIVSERMRRDGLALQRSVRRVELRRMMRRFTQRFGLREPFDVHEAVASYYLMRQRLLALYETSHAGLYPTLASAL
jgi:hypothetical protein